MSAPQPLPGLRPPEAHSKGKALRVVRPPPTGKDGTPPDAPLSPPAPARQSQLRPASDAWLILAAPLRAGSGIRVGALGITGRGKTTGLIQFLQYLRDQGLISLVLIHDIKLPTIQYPHDRIAYEATAVISNPPTEYPCQVVLRRRELQHTPSVDLAARVTNHASYNGVRTMLVVDEFHRALTPAGREFTAPAVGETLSEGRAIGASLLWTTQLPQRVPPTAYDQSQIILFGCGAKACAYLVSANVIDERTAAVVAALAVGQFIIVSEGEWDGVIYEVPPPAPATATAYSKQIGGIV